jgi:hypothetical protein
MTDDERAAQSSSGEAADSGAEIPKHQSPSEAGEEGEPPSYRKAEEDSTMLADEERTGDDTGAKAGEYS